MGQYLTTRDDVHRERRERSAADRAERKEAILGFLSAALAQTAHDYTLTASVRAYRSSRTPHRYAAGTTPAAYPISGGRW